MDGLEDLGSVTLTIAPYSGSRQGAMPGFQGRLEGFAVNHPVEGWETTLATVAICWLPCVKRHGSVRGELLEGLVTTWLTRAQLIVPIAGVASISIYPGSSNYGSFFSFTLGLSYFIL